MGTYRKRLQSRRLLKAELTLLVVFFSVATISLGINLYIKHNANAAEDRKYFFQASKETQDSFRGDVVYEPNQLIIGDNSDAYIRQEYGSDNGILYIDYASSTKSAKEDGVYTIWGEGGSIISGNRGFVKFRMRADNPDYAKQFEVRFYNGGNQVAQYNFYNWLKNSGYSDAQIESAANGAFTDFKLSANTDGYQGMKLFFNQGDSGGTIMIDSITFGDDFVFDNFDYSTDRGKYYKDAMGYLPMFRPESTLEGAYAGYNRGPNMMWTASTMKQSIVNNSDSTERALHLKGGWLEARTIAENETLIALRIKGDREAVGMPNMRITFMQGSGEYRPPFTFWSSFRTDLNSLLNMGSEDDTGTVTLNNNNYQTVYAQLNNISFDRISFGFDEPVYITDVYFPRFSYTVEHYYDGILDESKTETYNDMKFQESIEDGYSDKSGSNYEITGVEYSNEDKKIAGSNDVIKVSYKKIEAPEGPNNPDGDGSDDLDNGDGANDGSGNSQTGTNPKTNDVNLIRIIVMGALSLGSLLAILLVVTKRH